MNCNNMDKYENGATFTVIDNELGYLLYDKNTDEYYKAARGNIRVFRSFDAIIKLLNDNDICNFTLNIEKPSE